MLIFFIAVITVHTLRFLSLIYEDTGKCHAHVFAPDAAAFLHFTSAY